MIDLEAYDLFGTDVQELAAISMFEERQYGMFRFRLNTLNIFRSIFCNLYNFDH